MPEELRARIKQARKKLRITQVQAAAAWGVPLNTLICWENNRRRPPAFALGRLNAMLDEILNAPPGGGLRRWEPDYDI